MQTSPCAWSIVEFPLLPPPPLPSLTDTFPQLWEDPNCHSTAGIILVSPKNRIWAKISYVPPYPPEMPNRFLWGLKTWIHSTCDPDSFLLFSFQNQEEIPVLEPRAYRGLSHLHPVLLLSFLFCFSSCLGVTFWFPSCVPAVPPLLPPSLPSSLARRAASSAEPSPGDSTGLVPCEQRGGGR